MILDLSPYGLNWKIDTSNPAAEIIPANYKNLISKTVISGSDYVVDNKVRYAKGAFLGAGSYGNVYECTKAGSPTCIVKEMVYDDSEQFRNTIAEVIIQIIVVKETESSNYPAYNLKGPFAPRVFTFGYNAASGTAFIFAEKMYKTVRNLIQPWTDEGGSIAYILSRIAMILSELYTKLAFNHRDFKSDNCMYIRDTTGKFMPRIIDFGFACIKYNNITINANTSRFAYCSIEGRDMSQMIYENVHYYPTAVGIFKPVGEALLTYVRNGKVCKVLGGKCGVTTWGNTYRFFNSKSGENPNGHPGIVKNVCLAFLEGRKWENELAWPSKRVAVPAPAPGPAAPGPAAPGPAVVNPCPSGKNYNPKTRRCINKCPPGKKRNASFKCVKNVGAAAPAPAVPAPAPAVPAPAPAPAVVNPCPSGKNYNPKTRRCINKCPPGKSRNTDFKCKKTRVNARNTGMPPAGRAAPVPVPVPAAPVPVPVPAAPVPVPAPVPKKVCPPNKPDYNPKTNRCVTACPPGKKRNANFKCK